MALGGLVLGSLILYLKGMRTTMFQLSGFYCNPKFNHTHTHIHIHMSHYMPVHIYTYEYSYEYHPKP